jgi:hypothetical protein
MDICLTQAVVRNGVPVSFASDALRALQTSEEDDERRRHKRLPITFPIEVSGVDPQGNIFREITVTTNVSEHGCSFELLRELSRGDVIAIQLCGRGNNRPPNAKPLLFEVMWVESSHRGWSVGASKMQGENIWHVAFPRKDSPYLKK